jgi:hypothetical protein
MLACLLALASPVPPDLSAGPPPAQRPQPAPETEDIPPRHLKIAGGLSLGLGAAALGVMIWRSTGAASYRRPIGILADIAADRTLTAAEHDALQDLRERRNGIRYQALGFALGGAVLTAVGVALVVAGHRAARTSRVSAAPWWLPGGGGLTVHVHLGAAIRRR